MPRTPMTVSEARKALVESLDHLASNFGTRLVREVKFSRHRVTFLDDTSDCSVTFAEMTNLSVAGWVGGTAIVKSNGKQLHFHHSIGGVDSRDAWFLSKSYAKMFVDAVFVLKGAALAPDTEEADFAAFSVSAKAWLVTATKPEMSDDALTYKVLAKDAFERKDFAAALDAYGKALDRYPMWPAGHYNAALLAAEAEDYELAAKHMRRYLVLASDAKDAGASKDKLLLWQLKAKE